MNELIETYEETLKNISDRIKKLQSQLNVFKTLDENDSLRHRISLLELEYSELCRIIHEMKSR
jgi:predicted  nucleic acid-binding Zn-ribbon protein